MSAIIIDTDAGTDDLMAIAYLLSLPDQNIEAITVVHGLAHVRPGANNLRRLLRLANREDLPVFEGEEQPLRGSRAFPAKWRELTDELPGVRLPEIPAGTGPSESAVQFLKRRLAEKQNPVRILALGPLTNLALALREVREPAATIREIVTMGGAVQVAGNLFDNNPDSANETAEWNIYCDPEAAAHVFGLAVPQLLVPLDATNRVPIKRKYVEEFASGKLTPLGQVVADVFGSILHLIDTGLYFAWDPLAAVAFVDPSVVEAKGARLEVIADGKNLGQTRLAAWDDASLMRVAVNANSARFASEFDRAFELTSWRPQEPGRLP